MITFEVGDLVEHDGQIGFVAWNENKHAGLTKDDGYVGIDLLTGSKGFIAPVKVEEVNKSSIKSLVDYYENELIKLIERFEDYRFNKAKLEKLEKQNKLLTDLLKTYLD